MGATSNQAKQRWNEQHYSQIKVSVPRDLADSFKAKCLHDDLSFASVLKAFMLDFSAEKPSEKPLSDPYATRPKRRKAISCIAEQISAILDAEQSYLDHIPDNLQSSPAYDAADHSVSTLQDALDLLREAY